MNNKSELTTQLLNHLTRSVLSYIVLYVSIILPGSIYAMEYDFKGQLSGWTIEAQSQETWQNNTGLRYIPEVSLNQSLNSDSFIDAEVSLNGFLTNDDSDASDQSDIEMYRLWLRFSSSQFEIRAGLQKITFGSAMLLRPLMWFDRINPRDPLQLTEGVYGLLGRYYFLNNANVWLWGLYGNDETKGWDALPSKKNKPEYGGRLQLPLLSGEIALTYHHREADLQNQIPSSPQSIEIPEDRFGLDGKWDIGIGLWFEGTLIHQDIEISPLPYQRLITIGTDYTFDFGNGLNLIGEYFTIEASEKAFSSGDGISFSAVSFGYPVGLLDSLTVMINYDWDNHDWYRFVNWQRMYDNWSLYLIGFWNPDQFQIQQDQQERSLFAGKGLQLMIVFNH